MLSVNAWNLSNSTGNTLSNLFSALDASDEIANIFCRDEKIDNQICKKYFRITEKDILKSVLSTKECGEVMSYECTSEKNDINVGNKQVDRLKKFRCTSLLLIR